MIEHFTHNGPEDLSKEEIIGKIKTMTENMEVSFDMKIEDVDECDDDYFYYVLLIEHWFDFAIRKSNEESKYYLHHEQWNGLGEHKEILKPNPINVSNNWKKEFLERFLKTHLFFANMGKFLIYILKFSRNFLRL